jgi:hypothetical protein
MRSTQPSQLDRPVGIREGQRVGAGCLIEPCMLSLSLAPGAYTGCGTVCARWGLSNFTMRLILTTIPISKYCLRTRQRPR